MQISNKYNEIEITNSEVIKLLDTASCYIIVTVITAKTEKRVKEFLSARNIEIWTTYSDKWEKERDSISKERNDHSKEINNEELDKRENILNDEIEKVKEFIGIINIVTSKLEKQERISEQINNNGIKIEENENQKNRYVLKENINKFISERAESYKLIEDELVKLKEFEQAESEGINVDELIEELKSALQVVQKIQTYI